MKKILLGLALIISATSLIGQSIKMRPYKLESVPSDQKKLMQQAKLPIEWNCQKETCPTVEIAKSMNLVYLNKKGVAPKSEIKIPTLVKEELRSNKKLFGFVKQGEVCLYKKRKGLVKCINLEEESLNSEPSSHGNQSPIGTANNQGTINSDLSGTLIGGMNNSGLVDANQEKKYDYETLDKPKNNYVIKRDINLIDPNTIASYTLGNNNKAIDFTLEYEELNAKELKTRHRKKLTEESSDTCLKDYFKTSGSTSNWKVFDGEGNSDITNIVPGAIYDMQDFDGTFFKVVEQYPRNNIKISLEETVQGAVTLKEVVNPKLTAEIREQGVKPILNALDETNWGANLKVAVDYERQYNEQQLDINVGGSIPYLGGSVSFDGNFSDNSINETYTYYLELEEEYFNLVATGDSVVSGEFFEEADLNSQKKFGYISKVTYGRRISVNIESLYDLGEIRYGAEISNDGIVDANASMSGSSFNESEYLTYTIYLQGGSTENDILITKESGDIDRLLSSIGYIVNSSNSNTKDAVPIKFTLRSLDGDRIVSTYSPIETMVETCNPTFKVWLDKIEMGSRLEDNLGETRIEVFGDWRVQRYDDSGTEELMPWVEVADRDNSYKFKRNQVLSFPHSHTASGGVEFTVKHDDLPGGYIKLKPSLDERDDWLTGNDDENFTGISNKIYLSDMPLQEVLVEAKQGKNILTLYFSVERIN